MNHNTRSSFCTGRATLLLALLLALAGLPATAAAQIYVNHAASGDNDGSTWADAHTDLQAALAAAAPGNEIWVAAGVYKPLTPVDTGSVTTTERQATFTLKNGVALYGGFAGTETDRERRDWQANLTVLSGDIDNDDITDANRVVVDADNIQGDNSFNVVTGSGTDATAILDGFVITAGLANGSVVPPCARCGGGMINYNGSPTLANIRFSGNSATEGGGMANFTSSPTLTSIRFSGNSASAYGGGMYNLFSSPALTNVSFSGNSASSHGGGMWNQDSSPTLTNVSFSGNFSGVGGGGMLNEFDSNPVIRNTIFWNNQANVSTGTAGASISNSFGATPQISYSLVQGCNPDGTWNNSCGNNQGNNLPDADPLFVDTPDPATAPASAGNLRLSAGSPALDVGNNAVVTVATDLAGNVRIANDVVDLGPYERPSSDCPAGGVIHVDHQATEPGDGQSWASAYTDLQDALVVTQACEIWVAAGVYKPTDDANDRSATFQLIDGVEIYGGFAGAETQRDQRDWQANLTVLSGDIDNDDTTDATGVVVDADDLQGNNSIHVVTGSDTDATAILDGFVITAGLANGSFADPCGLRCGGGMFNNNGSPTLANIRFSGNRAADDGGGMWNRSSSSPVLTNVTFSGNGALTHGGGMYNESSSPTLTNVTFSGNSASSLGGGMYNLLSSNPTLTNVTFSGNSAGINGGGMSNLLSSNSILTNVTFSGNQADGAGGGMRNWESDPVIRNTIFWNNLDQSGTSTDSASISNDTSTPQVSYSLVQGCNPDGVWETSCGNNQDNNLPDDDPLFVDTPDPATAPTAAGNLRLRVGSPAIDAGNDDFVVGTGTDLDGNARIIGQAVDLGPFEADAFLLTIDIVGQGTVGADPEQVEYTAGTEVQLTATGDPGWSLSEWSSDLAGSNNPEILIIDGNMSVTATFTNDPPVADAGPDQSVNAGTEVTLDGSGSFDAAGDDITYQWTQVAGETVTLSDPVAVNPTFTAPFDETPLVFELVVTDSLDQASNPDSVTITVSLPELEVSTSVGNGQGSITPDTQNVTWGEDASFTVAPEEGWSTTTVSGDTCTPMQTAEQTWVASNITEDCVVTANFAIDVYTVTATVAAGQGSVLPPSQNVEHGESAVFTVAPAAGWSIDTITGDTCTPEVTGDDQWQAPNITEDCAVEASFAINQYALGGEVNGLEGEGLTLDLNGIETLAIGANGLFTFVTELDHDSDYTVTATEQPTNPNQTCSVANANGRINAADVTNVAVTCATPSLVLDLDVIAFGNINAETNASGEVSLTNNSEAPVTISEITDPDEPFAVTGGSCLPVPATLEPGEDCTIEVTYAPGSETAQHENSFEIVSDAPSSPDQVQLSGHSFFAIPVPINRSATLTVLVLLLLLAGWWKSRGQPKYQDI